MRSGDRGHNNPLGYLTDNRFVFKRKGNTTLAGNGLTVAKGSGLGQNKSGMESLPEAHAHKSSLTSLLETKNPIRAFVNTDRSKETTNLFSERKKSTASCSELPQLENSVTAALRRKVTWTDVKIKDSETSRGMSPGLSRGESTGLSPGRSSTRFNRQTSIPDTAARTSHSNLNYSNEDSYRLRIREYLAEKRRPETPPPSVNELIEKESVKVLHPERIYAKLHPKIDGRTMKYKVQLIDNLIEASNKLGQRSGNDLVQKNYDMVIMFYKKLKRKVMERRKMDKHLQMIKERNEQEEKEKKENNFLAVVDSPPVLKPIRRKSVRKDSFFYRPKPVLIGSEATPEASPQPDTQRNFVLDKVKQGGKLILQIRMAMKLMKPENPEHAEEEKVEEVEEEVEDCKEASKGPPTLDTDTLNRMKVRYEFRRIKDQTVEVERQKKENKERMEKMWKLIKPGQVMHFPGSKRAQKAQNEVKSSFDPQQPQKQDSKVNTINQFGVKSSYSFIKITSKKPPIPKYKDLNIGKHKKAISEPVDPTENEIKATENRHIAAAREQEQKAMEAFLPSGGEKRKLFKAMGLTLEDTHRFHREVLNKLAVEAKNTVQSDISRIDESINNPEKAARQKRLRFRHTEEATEESGGSDSPCSSVSSSHSYAEKMLGRAYKDIADGNKSNSVFKRIQNSILAKEYPI